MVKTYFYVGLILTLVGCTSLPTTPQEDSSTSVSAMINFIKNGSIIHPEDVSVIQMEITSQNKIFLKRANYGDRSCSIGSFPSGSDLSISVIALGYSMDTLYFGKVWATNLQGDSYQILLQLKFIVDSMTVADTTHVTYKDTTRMRVFDTTHVTYKDTTHTTVADTTHVTHRDTTVLYNTVLRDTVTTTGYRYYKFVVLSKDLGTGSCMPYQCAILTETHFLKSGKVYPDSSYKMISYENCSNPWSLLSLFDGDSTVGTESGNYIKFDNVPWGWVIDMGSMYVFDTFYLSSWETFFYREPSDIEIYGANDLSNTWTRIGKGIFTTTYRSKSIPLVYP